MKSIITRTIITAVLLFIICNTFFRSGNEYRTELNFKISKIEVSPTHSLKLFDAKGEGVLFWNYSIGDRQGIAVGDSIYKGACTEKLYVFKKDINNKYRFYSSTLPSGIIPLSWFCN